MVNTVCLREGCGAALPVAGRGPVPKYCSTRCRVASHRARRAAAALPKELTTRRRWVRRDSRKAPLRIDGSAASVSAPETWSSYDAAVASAAGAGIGYVLTAADGVACIDLDHCLFEGELKQWARDIVDRCPPTFIEVSAGGEGLHIWGRAKVERGRRIRSNETSVEVYGDGRYIAVTGRRFEDCKSKLADLTDVIASLI